MKYVMFFAFVLALSCRTGYLAEPYKPCDFKLDRTKFVDNEDLTRYLQIRCREPIEGKRIIIGKDTCLVMIVASR